MSQPSRYAVIVDPLGTGQEFPAAFRAEGVEAVAVLSLAEPAPLYRESWHPENFRHVHALDGDLAALADIVRSYQPICVIPGCESGVELADALIDLVLPGSGNVPELATARRDKWQMDRAVGRAGIPHLRQFCSADPEEIERWLDDTALRGAKLVVKPPKSAATDEVHLVPAGGTWRPFFDRIYGRPNIMGLTNDAVLVEEFAEGTEYLIDSYSVDGKHGLVDVCRYNRVQRGDRIGVYDLVQFVAPDHPGAAAVWPYARQVLDAIGIRTGSAHTEVMLTRDGPRLLEVGARPAGGGHQMISKLATGSNHIERTVAHRVRGDWQEGYQLIKHVSAVIINSPVAGVWRNADVFDGVESLPTFWMKHFDFGTDDHVPAAGSMATMLGWVVLASTDEQAVAADYERLKELESRIRVDEAELATP